MLNRNSGIPVQQSEWIDIFGPHITFLTGVSTTQDDYALVLGVVGPGVTIPLHSHEDRETMFVLSGNAQAYVGGEWMNVSAGDVVDVRSNTPHALHNNTHTELRVLKIVTSKMEQFFREIGKPVSQTPEMPTAEEIARLMDASARFGFWTGSPADNAKIGLVL
ncbi:cupin domain-containing protein [Rhizobium leguminosarum]|uniref:cupin domain-containing protein n=1 Tax=Rhizobium TaxID=379 RepID=UPI0010323A22|nr:cupin domain-containing protein [Rhizobium leguminosarum]TBF87484.1 cupin domain-containing protein [Rhizobium leguminosarum]TBG06960.1 cupin domain-containing protein [Rhizobium leguminosarum]TBG07831.1 cupin domain-containing protein [Rhizobium leguminosarum]TBG29997.1 cupin domain-containing protein [Rhizobium leguminosarum]TBG50130.1 cupin domain-containing protein [Rhizobium leguminosarum]